MKPCEDHCPIGDVHANHEQGAMREIDNLEHAEDDGEAQSGKPINGSHKNAIDDVFKNVLHPKPLLIGDRF